MNLAPARVSPRLCWVFLHRIAHLTELVIKPVVDSPLVAPVSLGAERDHGAYNAGEDWGRPQPTAKVAQPVWRDARDHLETAFSGWFGR